MFRDLPYFSGGLFALCVLTNYLVQLVVQDVLQKKVRPDKSSCRRELTHLFSTFKFFEKPSCVFIRLKSQRSHFLLMPFIKQSYRTRVLVWEEKLLQKYLVIRTTHIKVKSSPKLLIVLVSVFFYRKRVEMISFSFRK